MSYRDEKMDLLRQLIIATDHDPRYVEELRRMDAGEPETMNMPDDAMLDRGLIPTAWSQAPASNDNALEDYEVGTFSETASINGGPYLPTGRKFTLDKQGNFIPVGE